MVDLTIKKDAIWAEIFDFPNKEHINKPIKSIFRHLNDIATIDKGVTFGDILKHLSKEKEDVNKFFSSNMGNFDFNLFLKELGNKPKEKTNIKTLVLKRHFDTPLRKNHEMYSFVNIYGVTGKDITKRSNTYAIDMLELSALKDIPIALNYNIEIYDNGIKSPKVLLKAKTQFTLYEIISCILYEISFYGSPKDRDLFKDDLIKRIDDINFEDGIDSKEVMKNLKKKLKKK